MKTTVRLLGSALLGLVLCLTGSARELSSYEETVALRPDGSAEIRLVLIFPDVAGAETLIPLRSASPQALDVKGLEPERVRLVENDGRRFLALDLSGSAPASRTVEITFRMESFFKAGPAGAFGNRDLAYRFVNVTFDRIDKFAAILILPPGNVYNTVDDFLPKAKASGGAVPYGFVRTEGRDAARLTAENLKLGDEARFVGTFKSGRKPPILLWVLLAAAVAYLVFFRGILKNEKNVTGPKP